MNIELKISQQTVVASIQETERFLRDALTNILASKHGVNWQLQLSAKTQQELNRLRDQEHRLRPKTAVDENLLSYAGLPEIKIICEHHWDCCTKSLELWKNKSSMTNDLNLLMTARGPSVHGRELQPYEILEAEGVARRLCFAKQRLSVSSEPEGRIGSFIKSAEDSLGNQSNLGPMPVLKGKNPLRVNDRIELKVHALDPKSRPMQYRLLDRNNALSLPWQGSPIFTWTAYKICESTELSIEVRSISGPWGSSEYDDFVEFRYSVHP